MILFNTKADINGEKNKKDIIHIKSKQQNGRHKSYLFSNYIKYEWTKPSNQREVIGRIDF